MSLTSWGSIRRARPRTAKLEFESEDDETDCWLALEFLNVTPDVKTNRHHPTARRFHRHLARHVPARRQYLETK